MCLSLELCRREPALYLALGEVGPQGLFLRNLEVCHFCSEVLGSHGAYPPLPPAQWGSSLLHRGGSRLRAHPASPADHQEGPAELLVCTVSGAETTSHPAPGGRSCCSEGEPSSAVGVVLPPSHGPGTLCRSLSSKCSLSPQTFPAVHSHFVRGTEVSVWVASGL